MRFVIIASPRTGSTHLTSLLNEQDDIACHGEIFHPKKVFVRWPRQDKAPEAMAKLMKLREQDPQHFLDHISANGRIYLVSSAARVGGDPARLITPYSGDFRMRAKSRNSPKQPSHRLRVSVAALAQPVPTSRRRRRD